MAVDRIKPLKLEGPESGGTETDQFPTSVDITEDYVDCRGITCQNGTSNDDAVRVERAGGDLQFLDVTNPTPTTLTQLKTASTGISEATHKTLAQLIHFIDNGPAAGFTSGAYREALPASSAFPTSIIWWTSSAKTQKIVEKLLSLGANKFPTTIIWKMYNSAGALVETVTDTYDYSGGCLLTPKITRTIA